MRFSPHAAVTAAVLVNEMQENELADLIYRYGEERFSRRIAHAIVDARKKQRIRTTSQLAAVVADAIPTRSRYGRIHPATRTFQALRIAVNDELGRLERACNRAPELLSLHGICAVISFHSLEDRIVKHAFIQKRATGDFSLVTKKPLTPSEKEVAENSRARSAKLRAIRSERAEERQMAQGEKVVAHNQAAQAR